MRIELNSKIYPLEAVLNACYSFIERAYIFLDGDSEKNEIIVSLKAKRQMSSKKLEVLKGEFMNELLHCSLRYTISKNNKKIRESIIGRALYSALSNPGFDLPDSDKEFDYRDDPLGIAVPWEEKYGKGKNVKSEV